MPLSSQVQGHNKEEISVATVLNKKIQGNYYRFICNEKYDNFATD